MRAGNFHVFPVFRNGAARYLNALRLQNASDLFVGQRPAWIFIFNELFDAPLQDEKRSASTFGALHAFGKEIS